MIYRCPRCTEPLVTAVNALYCSSKSLACDARYPIIDDIPRFVPKAVDDGFDMRWAQHAKPQATTTGIFSRKTGFSRADLEGRLILDAGCGCGRFTDEAARLGARMVGVDGSTHGVEAAKRLVPAAEIVQANLLALPFEDETFDAAFSIGVLHHTENTEAAFREVARTIKRGGAFAVWVYTKPVSDDLLALSTMLHEITRACPPAALHAAFARWAPKIRDSYAGAWGPLQQILRVSNSKDDDECVSDTFDWHTPQYRWWHTVEEVSRWFGAAGFKVDRVGDFPVCVRGRRL